MTMTGLELRSALAFAQAELAILSEHARVMDEINVSGDIELAGEKLRQAFDRLSSYVALSGEQSAWFGRAGEIPPFVT